MTQFQQKQLALMRQMEASHASGSAVSAVVPIQTDYVNDPQLCLTCVSYLPKNIATTIQTTIIDPLKALEPEFYFYPVQSLHITIQNIRVINDPPHFGATEIAKAQALLSKIIPQYGPFQFELKGTIHMPTSVAIIALVSPEYDTFILALRQRLIDAGIPDDKKYFTDEMVFANTTICRYTHTPSQEFLQKLETMKDIFIGTFNATEMSLAQMNAGAHPSKTTVFGTYQFQNRHA